MKIINTIILSLILSVGIVNAADPLSRDGLQPTSIPFDTNTAVVSDTLAGFPDVAYFMITVPEGEQLSAIMTTSDENSDGGYWFAVMSGAQFTENSTQSSQINTDNILGHAVIRGLDNNYLPNMGNDGIGFDDVLPAGTYSFRIQNWGSGGTFTLELMTEPAATVPTAINLNTLTTGQGQHLYIILIMTSLLTVTNRNTLP